VVNASANITFVASFVMALGAARAADERISVVWCTDMAQLPCPVHLSRPEWTDECWSVTNHLGETLDAVCAVNVGKYPIVTSGKQLLNL
jgi:hypothetical protein